MLIPKTIHFIWAGGGKPIPKKNLRTILQWKKNNPSFNVWMWIDTQTTSNYLEHYETLLNEIKFDEPNLFPEDIDITHHLVFKGIDTLISENHQNEGIEEKKEDDEQGTLPTWQHELYGIVRHEIDRLKPNFGVSSDLLRYLILFKYGGAYFDSDVLPGSEPLENSDIFNQDEVNHYFFYVDQNSQNTRSVGNDALISTPHNPCLEFIARLAIDNYLWRESYYEISRVPKHTIYSINFGGDLYSFTTYCYAHDSANYISNMTPIITGPNVVRSVVCDRFNSLLDNLDQTIYIRHIDERYRKIARNHRNWISEGVPLITEEEEDLSEVYERVFESIKFEMSELHILRLPEHINQLMKHLRMDNTEDAYSEIYSALEALLLSEELNFSSLRTVQMDYSIKQVVDFYEEHNLLWEKSALFPTPEKEEGYDAAIYHATKYEDFDILYRKVRDGEVLSTQETKTLNELIQYQLLFLKDAALYIKNNTIEHENTFKRYLEKLGLILRTLENTDLQEHMNIDAIEKIAQCRDEIETIKASHICTEDTLEFYTPCCKPW